MKARNMQKYISCMKVKTKVKNRQKLRLKANTRFVLHFVFKYFEMELLSASEEATGCPTKHDSW